MAIKLTNCDVYLDSRRLGKMATVKIDRSVNLSKAYTVDGIAYTTGTFESTITVSSMVPAENFDVDPVALGMDKGKKHTLTVVAAGRSGSCEGVFETDSFDGGVNTNAGHSFTFWGKGVEWD